MKIKIKITFIFLIIITFSGCDEYFDLTDEEKSLLLYDEGDTFKLKHNNDTLIFNVTNKKICYQPYYNYLCGNKNYYQTGEVEFICYSDNEEIITNYPNYIIEDDGIKIRKTGSGIDYRINIINIYGTDFKEKNITINVNDQEYSNVYLTGCTSNDSDHKIYISPEKGIIKAENDSVTYTIVE